MISFLLKILNLLYLIFKKTYNIIRIKEHEIYILIKLNYRFITIK